MCSDREDEEERITMAPLFTVCGIVMFVVFLLVLYCVLRISGGCSRWEEQSDWQRYLNSRRPTKL